MARAERAQAELPVQPVSKPILRSPYEEPDQHWNYREGNREAYREPGRRPASYWYQTRRTGSSQMDMLAEERATTCHW